jgi:hypothetical protein
MKKENFETNLREKKAKEIEKRKRKRDDAMMNWNY